MFFEPQDAGDLAADLALLRKNEGFVARRLARAVLVMEVLRQREDDSFDRLRNRFVSALYSLEADEAALLLDVFALSVETEGLPRLQQRRAEHGRKIGRGVDTIATREKAALDHLVSRLVRGTYAQAPLPLDVPEMHDGIIYETSSTVVLVENRRWKETWEHYRVLATFDEMDYLTITRSYDGAVVADPAGRFRVSTRATSRGFNDHYWHLDECRRNDEPMKRGRSYDLRFRIVAAGGESPLTLVSRAFHERALLATIQVRFRGEAPTSLWRHERVSFFDAPGSPSESMLQSLGENGTLTLRLRDAHGGLFSGFAWKW